MKPITPEMHRTLDFASAGMLFTLPRLLRWSPGVTQFMTMMAVGTTIYSLLTRYKHNQERPVAMETHLTLDKISAATFLAAPILFRHESPVTILMLMAIGGFEMGAATMTEPESPRMMLPRAIWESVRELITD